MKIRTNISLRGSLADDCARKMLSMEVAQKQLNRHIERLLKSNNPDLLKINNKGNIIIGKRSERGKFPPDW
jgi:hypothetical protein